MPVQFPRQVLTVYPARDLIRNQLLTKKKVDYSMPLFLAKREVYSWLREGKKTVDVRKGRPRSGNVAVFQSGRSHLRKSIAKKEIGILTEVIRADNYKKIIPSAENVEEARNYLINIYGKDSGIFTAYYLSEIRI